MITDEDKDILIAILTLQLQEKEEQIKMLEEHKFYADNIIQTYADKCKNYEKQLAEKEEMIKKLSEFILEAKKGTDFLFKQDNKNLREQLAQADQDKVSFCIEQLEKVKKLLYPELRFDYSLYLRVMHEIDNQIEELKKGE